jgi:Protein of unknown function with HXXEE motif
MNQLNDLPHFWFLLFPLTYFIHVIEEYFGGSAATRKGNKVDGTNVSPAQFVLFNGFGIVLMLIGFFIARTDGFLHWLTVMLGTLVLVNALSHAYATISRRKYNPGFVSGVLLWAPLGIYTLYRLAQFMPAKRFVVPMLVAFAIQLTVSLISRNGDALWGAGLTLGTAIEDGQSATEG